jgi:hypothetical protein
MPLITRSKNFPAKAHALKKQLNDIIIMDIVNSVVNDDAIVDISIPVEEEKSVEYNPFVGNSEYFENGKSYADDLYVGLEDGEIEESEDSGFIQSSPSSPTMSAEYWSQFQPPGFSDPIEPLPVDILDPGGLTSPVVDDYNPELEYIKKYGTGFLTPCSSQCSSLSYTMCEFPTYYSPSSSPVNIPNVPSDPMFSGQIFSPFSFTEANSESNSPCPFASIDDIPDTNTDMECVN